MNNEIISTLNIILMKKDKDTQQNINTLYERFKVELLQLPDTSNQLQKAVTALRTYLESNIDVDNQTPKGKEILENTLQKCGTIGELCKQCYDANPKIINILFNSMETLSDKINELQPKVNLASPITTTTTTTTSTITTTTTGILGTLQQSTTSPQPIAQATTPTTNVQTQTTPTNAEPSQQPQTRPRTDAKSPTKPQHSVVSTLAKETTAVLGTPPTNKQAPTQNPTEEKNAQDKTTRPKSIGKTT